MKLIGHILKVTAGFFSCTVKTRNVKIAFAIRIGIIRDLDRNPDLSKAICIFLDYKIAIYSPRKFHRNGSTSSRSSEKSKSGENPW